MPSVLPLIVRAIVLPVCIILVIMGAGFYSVTIFFKDIQDMVLEKLRGSTPENITSADELVDHLEDFSNQSLEKVVHYRYFFIIVGVFFFSLGSGGIVALFWKNVYFRGVYAALVAVILALLIFSVTQKSKVLEDTRSSLKEYLADYDGIKGNNTASKIWDLIHVKLDCCGVDGYEDFQNLTHWPPNGTESLRLMTPISCCKKIDVTNITCAQIGTATKENNWMDKGCLHAVEKPLEYLLSSPYVFIPPLSILFVGTIVLIFTDVVDKITPI